MPNESGWDDCLGSIGWLSEVLLLIWSLSMEKSQEMEKTVSRDQNNNEEIK